MNLNVYLLEEFLRDDNQNLSNFIQLRVYKTTRKISTLEKNFNFNLSVLNVFKVSKKALHEKFVPLLVH